MKVAEHNSLTEVSGETVRHWGDSLTETSGGRNKDAEDNSLTEILGSNLSGDSIIRFNVSSLVGKNRVSIKPRVGWYNEWFPEMERDLI